MAWSYTWDEAEPQAGDPANQAHVDMQSIMQAVRERLAVGHDATDGDDTDTYSHLVGTARISQGVYGSLPAFGTSGRFYYATDTSQLLLDTGSAWLDTTDAMLTAMAGTPEIIWNIINDGGDDATLVGLSHGGFGEDVSIASGWPLFTAGVISWHTATSQVSSADTTPGYLGNGTNGKVRAGWGIEGTLTNPGGNEYLDLAVQPLAGGTSLEVTTNGLRMIGDQHDPGSSYYYGTDDSGVKGYYLLDITASFIGRLCIADENMTVDETNYTVNMMLEDGTEDVTTQYTDVWRVTGMPNTADGDVGMLVYTSDTSQKFFIPIINPNNFAAAMPVYDGTPDQPAGDTATIDNNVEAADTDDWNLLDGTGVLWLVTRVAFDHTGDSTLYGYRRAIYFDEDGRITSVSAETRYTIETPEAC